MEQPETLLDAARRGWSFPQSIKLPAASTRDPICGGLKIEQHRCSVNFSLQIPVRMWEYNLPLNPRDMSLVVRVGWGDSMMKVDQLAKLPCCCSGEIDYC